MKFKTLRNIITAFSLLFTQLGVSQEIKLVDYYMSECSSDRNSYMEIDRVSAISLSDIGLTDITLSVKGNCAMSDSISISSYLDSIFFTINYPVVTKEYTRILQDDSSYLILESSSYELADCECCFTFNLTLSDYDHSIEYTFIADGDVIPFTNHRFPLKTVSFEILEGDTINYSDIYGFRQGRWLFFSPKNLCYQDAFYLDSEIIHGKLWKVYDENNNLVSEEEYKDGCLLYTSDAADE